MSEPTLRRTIPTTRQECEGRLGRGENSSTGQVLGASDMSNPLKDETCMPTRFASGRKTSRIDYVVTGLELIERR